MLPSYKELVNLQRVNMSRSMCFQLDHEAFFTLAKVGPHNLMFYDMIRGQYDRLVCSVQKKKERKDKKNVKERKKEKRAKKQTKQKE